MNDRDWDLQRRFEIRDEQEPRRGTLDRTNSDAARRLRSHATDVTYPRVRR